MDEGAGVDMIDLIFLGKASNTNPVPGKLITKTCQCNIQRIFSALKMEEFIGNKLIFLLKTLIVGTC